mmetsp:Transcript_78049/g.233915  ORF Transcript_78049/g.233915 Transcript_78049/m.233915 type:complete len:409 (+) Transcript_78049:3-1229(+)
MTYDLETHHSELSSSRSSIGESAILMASMHCHTCGYMAVVCNMGPTAQGVSEITTRLDLPLCDGTNAIAPTDVKVVFVRSSTDVANAVLQAIREHGARWVGGFNNVGFDNKFLAHWCSADYEDMLTQVPGGCKIDTPRSATYDLYRHITKFHPGEYRRDNLDTIAVTDLGTGKLDVGTGAFGVQHMGQYADDQQIRTTIKYCMIDSIACSKVFTMSRPSLARGYMGELEDLCTHLRVWPSLICSWQSGIYAECLMWCSMMSNGLCIVPSSGTFSCDVPGGNVLSPCRGLYICGVTEIDITQHYPHIISEHNVSLETCTACVMSHGGLPPTYSDASALLVLTSQVVYLVERLKTHPSHAMRVCRAWKQFTIWRTEYLVATQNIVEPAVRILRTIGARDPKVRVGSASEM